MKGARGSFDELSEFIERTPGANLGCLVDTTILFSASYHLDLFNEDAEVAFEALAQLKVPIYSNANVRSEFLDLHRKILIPECLIDLLEDAEKDLDGALVQKLKSLRTRYRRAIDDKKSFKLHDHEIKDLRRLLGAFKDGSKDGWELFCENYLHGKIEPLWDKVVEELGLNFIDMRSDEESSKLIGPVGWKGATDLVGRFGIGSTDAMILDLFFNSKFKILLTSDRDIAYCVDKCAAKGQFVFLPDSLCS